MRKNLLLLMLLVRIWHPIHSQEAAAVKGDFEFKLNYGNFGWGMNVFSGEYDVKFSASLINFFIEHDKTNIGIEVSPLKYMANYSAIYRADDSLYAVDTRHWNQDVYFLNGSLYWNPFDIKNIILGPFVSIHYLGIEDWSEFSTRSYVFSSGLRFLLRTYLRNWKQPFQIIGSEIGYRNISGKHAFYFNVTLDISVWAWFIAAVFIGEASEVKEANEDYERQIGGTGPFIPKEPKQPKPPFEKDNPLP
ncbi:MAG: hypothetical protein LBP93_08685 [Treponema sp.]|jgi:hypothetical protein|nr:hypothetical protein [Treponema sp.]